MSRRYVSQPSSGWAPVSMGRVSADAPLHYAAAAAGATAERAYYAEAGRASFGAVVRSPPATAR